MSSTGSFQKRQNCTTYSQNTEDSGARPGIMTNDWFGQKIRCTDATMCCKYFGRLQLELRRSWILLCSTKHEWLSLQIPVLFRSFRDVAWNFSTILVFVSKSRRVRIAKSRVCKMSRSLMGQNSSTSSDVHKCNCSVWLVILSPSRQRVLKSMP